MKKIFFVLLGVCLFSNIVFSQSQADSLLKFILKNKTKASIYLQTNDFVTANLNEDLVMPLANVEKIIVATEFAKQSAYNVFSFNKSVALEEINQYYIRNADGGAHANWLKYENRIGHLKKDSVKLIDVARGMIMYNSNPNTEFLMDMLGFTNIQNNVRMYGLKKHTTVYPMVASLFVFQNPKDAKEEDTLNEIINMSDSTYQEAIFDIHKQLKFESTYQSFYRPLDVTPKMQQLWMNRLTAGTVKEYARVCRIINNRLILNEKSFAVLAKLLETVMETPLSKNWFKRAGSVGGNVGTSFTKAAYATLKDNTKVELVYFFKDLSVKEIQNLKTWSNDFETKVLRDEKFRKKVSDGLTEKK